MSVRNIDRRSIQVAKGSANAAPIRLDPSSNSIKVIGGGAGATAEQEYLSINTVPLQQTAATLPVVAATMSGRTIALNRAAGITVTLPAASGSGNKYRFVVQATASGGNYVIQVANANDYMIGVAFFDGDDAGNAANGFTTANTGTPSTESDTITMDGTTRGGVKGAIVEIEDLATNIFSVRVFSAASGAEASPFSVAV